MEANRTRMLMYAYPSIGGSGGQLYFETGLEALAEFYPNIDEREAVDALSELNKAYAGGDALDALLDRIERFLTEQVRHTDVRALSDLVESIVISQGFTIRG